MNKKSRDFEVSHLRSVGAVIRDGYLLFLDHFRRIFRASWLVALIYALISGAASSLMVKLLPEIVFMHSLGIQQQMVQPAVTLGLVAVVVSLATAILYATAFSLLKGHRQTVVMPTATHWYGLMERKSLIRTLTAWACLLFIGIIVSLLTGMLLYFIGQHLSPLAYHVCTGIVLLVYALIAPLLLMLLIRYVFSEAKSPFSRPLPPRYWGNTIIVTLVIVIITQLLSMVTELPTNILTIANIQSQMGTLKGDPVGMPDYMTWLNIVAFTLAAFIKAYVLLSALFPFYYLNGSIEAQEKERAEMAQRFQTL